MGKENEYETKLPDSVLKQQREADAAMRQITAPEAGKTDDVILTDKKVEPTTPEPTNAEPVIIPAIPDTTDSTFHHKYNVLKGKYDKEIGDLRAKSVELEATIQRQSQVIEDINSKQSAPQSGSTPALGEDINLEDFESWGDEIKGMAKQMNAMKAIIGDQAQIISGLKTGGPAAHTVDPELASRIENLEESGRQSTIETYQKTLNTQCPQWEKLNVDPKFNDWLDVQDPITMIVRRDIIGTAASNFRGAQVANIFNAYLNEARGTVEPKADPLFQELPNGGSVGDQGEANRRPTTTLNDVKKAQDQYVKGVITEDEYDKISAQYQRSLGR